MMIDIGKYSLHVSPYHLYRRSTLRKLLMMFEGVGYKKKIKDINTMIDNSPFTKEMQDKYTACMYLRETTDDDWARFVLEDNKITL